MKRIAFLVIFAFVFSSFSAVAGAYCAGDCVHAGSSSVSLDTSSCTNHQKTMDSEKSSNGKTSKSVCVDCHHCCSAHAVGLRSFDTHVMNISASLVPLSPDVIDVSGYLFSLLRPPKFLV